MLKVTPISDIAYLTESAADAPSSIAYYTDTKSKSEPPGRWWCPGGWIAKDGDIASALAVTRLAQGRHPNSGRKIVDGKGDQKRAAYDLTFSTPKSWTALWVVSDMETRSTLDDMLMASVRESLDEVLASGLIEARIGKGGAVREPMKSLVAALYRHTTSREGDPQAHIHAALLNVGLRRDGQMRAINNEKLCEVHKRIGASFRLRLAEKLEAVGVPIRANVEHGFVIDGQPAELADIWSKRRKQIVAAAQRDGLATTAGSLKKVDALVKQTRGQKTDLPSMDFLEGRWRQEAATAGWTPMAEWSRLDRPAIVRTTRQDAQGAVAVVRQAIETITEKQSLFYRREVEALALTLAVGRCSAVAVGKVINLILAGPEVIDTQRDGMLTTRIIVAQEEEIVQIARSLKRAYGSGFSKAALQVAMADSKFSDEQRDAIKHALAAHSVSVIEGGPGVGKTTASAAVKMACEQDGRRLILAAPSWTATETLKTELAHDGPAYALDRLLFNLKTGKMTLARGDVVLLDEAGMTSTTQMLVLMRAAQQAGAKLILQGDSNQIAAVSRGDPLALIARVIGSQEIRAIRRQKVAWQRTASMAAQDGKIGQALMAYAGQGRVEIAQDSEAVLAAMGAAFKAAAGDVVAIAATNLQVAGINAVLRRAAGEMGIISGPELTIRAVPRGQKGRPRPVDLALAQGDQLILGGEAVIGGVTLRNASRLTVRGVNSQDDSLTLQTADGRVLVTSKVALERAGKKGAPLVMQHAFAVTAHAAQGATWSKTLWLASHEDRRSALVAMTRHRDDLQVFVDRSTLPKYADAMINVDKRGIVDPEQPIDDRSDMQIVAATGRSMERVTAPRNTLDLLGVPTARVGGSVQGRKTDQTSPNLRVAEVIAPIAINAKNPDSTLFAGRSGAAPRNRQAKWAELQRQSAAVRARRSSAPPVLIKEPRMEDRIDGLNIPK